MTCSVLIPSRARFDRLLSSVDSILRHSNPSSDVEIWVRLDEDDSNSIARVNELTLRGVKVAIGSRMNGHASLHDFYNEIAELAQGDWVFFLNDDITIESTFPNWLDQLKGVPTRGSLACARYYNLGASRYNEPAMACPIVPRGCWKEYGWTGIASCVDEAFKKLLVVENGWSIVPLPSLTVNHHRDSDEQLRQHRLMGGRKV